MGKTSIRVTPLFIEHSLFGHDGDIKIIGAGFDHQTGDVTFMIEGDDVPDCYEGVVTITEHYRTIKVTPRD